MRWFAASAVALLLAWGGFLLSPYWALGRLAAAVERRDPAAVAARVNFRALRNSTAKQLAAELEPPGKGPAMAPGGAPVAAALTAALEPALARLLSPEGVIALLGAPGPRDGSDASPLGGGLGRLSKVESLFRASQWRGFRNVYFTLPPDAPRSERFRLQMRLSSFRWRLVGIELPPDRLKEAAEAALGRRRAP